MDTGERPQHIHGVGVDPADGSVLLATHGGLFAAPAGERQARRVGRVRQDMMGFTVVGPGRFLASGHPAISQREQGPMSGLIASDDAGRRWRTLALGGVADFHVLRAAGRRVYGVVGNGELMLSRDWGRGWRHRTAPAQLMDLVIAPRDPQHLVASTPAAVMASGDEGATWEKVAVRRGGLLAWPRPDALYLIDAQGRLDLSSDGGRSWVRRGVLPGRVAALATHGADLYAALEDGRVTSSSDGGLSWRTRLDA
jgi:hypothetical protein